MPFEPMPSAPPLPMVLRSRAALGAALSPRAGLPLTPLGATYSMTQEASWIDADHFAVGRWDGSLSLFSFTASPAEGPKIVRAVNGPGQEGVQMITPLPGAAAFFSSNDDGSILLWWSDDGGWSDLRLAATLAYDPEFGVANSGAVLEAQGRAWFVAGHANGRVSLWGGGPDAGDWTLETVADVRSGRPVNPWGLANVRGIAVLPPDAACGYVIAGSEDGNLTVVRVPDGQIMAAVVYNPDAQRGINSLTACGTVVLVANCAVGAADSNLWSFLVDPSTWSIRNTGRANLVVDPQAPQVFNFDVVWGAPGEGAMSFFCSTEEGALWMGRAAPTGALTILGFEQVTAELGSALCFDAQRLIVAAYDLREFGVGGSA
ncbi:MAG: hypothetical protein Q8Q88_06535 [Phenylobacterium sp.]|uniref:hypothetical protein n=1 Tax=Phenylobacterium sp. TaxID=1871053 RepID=UPI002734A1A5|nr:hypothetical protein [Phenylobacterium sp.]MDP3746691.1 hypothetical protein [Phenylobacterium sp.]